MSKRTASLAKMNEKSNHSLAKKRKLSGPGVTKSSPSPVHSILHLQRTKGNQVVQRLLKSGKIQAKLKIGKPNDKYEQEADRVADKVMSMPEPGIQRQLEEEKEEIQTKPLAEQITPLVQRQVGPEEEEEPIQTKLLQRQAEKEEEEESVQTKRIQRQEAEEEEEPVQTKLQRQAEKEEEPIQTKLVQRQANPEEEEETQTKLQRQPEDEEEEPIQKQPLEEEEDKIQRQTQEEEEKEPIQAKPSINKTSKATSNIESSVNSLKDGGQPLAESARSYFEPRFGADFSQVRLHTDSKAADTAKSINAKAFTKGKDVVFGSGQYSPETSSGKRLLAHELTHVVQQGKKKSTSKFERKIACEQFSHISTIQKANSPKSTSLTFTAWLWTRDGIEYNKIRSVLEAAKYKFITHVKTGNKWEKKFPTSKTPASQVAWSIGTPEGKWKWATTANVVARCKGLLKTPQKSLTWTAWLVSRDGIEYNKLRTVLEAAKYKFITHVRGYGGKWEKKFPTSKTPASQVAWSIGTPEGKWEWATTANVVAMCRKLFPSKLLKDFASKFPDAVALIRKSPSAMKLVIEAEKAGVKFGGYAENGPGKGAWPYTSGKKVYVPKARTDKIVAMSDFLFELNNAIRAPKFAKLDKEAAKGTKGTLTAKQYAYKKVELEVEGMLRMGKIWFTMKKTIGKGAKWNKYDNDFFLNEYKAFKAGRKTKNDIVNDVLKWPNGLDKGKTNEQFYIDQYKELGKGK